jgi:hypothetical protein
MLKKEFKRKDVERMRNLIKGNTNSSTEIQVGYTKKQEDHKEGDIWEENGKSWTIKNGIKQTATKLDKIKKEATMPLFCPTCSKLMKHHLNAKFYKIHKMCMDCVIEMEHHLRIEGKYEEYERNMIAANASAKLEDMEAYLLDAINTNNNGFVSENGEIERWKGGLDKKEATKAVEEAVKHFKQNIEDYKNGVTNDTKRDDTQDGSDGGSELPPEE